MQIFRQQTQNICAETGITLSRYMLEVARQNPQKRDLPLLLGGIQQACKVISKVVDRAEIVGIGYGDKDNTLVHTAHDVLLDALKATGTVGILAPSTPSADDFPLMMDSIHHQREIVG